MLPRLWILHSSSTRVLSFEEREYTIFSQLLSFLSRQSGPDARLLRSNEFLLLCFSSNHTARWIALRWHLPLLSGLEYILRNLCDSLLFLTVGYGMNRGMRLRFLVISGLVRKDLLVLPWYRASGDGYAEPGKTECEFESSVIWAPYQNQGIGTITPNPYPNWTWKEHAWVWLVWRPRVGCRIREVGSEMSEDYRPVNRETSRGVVLSFPTYQQDCRISHFLSQKLSPKLPRKVLIFSMQLSSGKRKL